MGWLHRGDEGHALKMVSKGKKEITSRHRNKNLAEVAGIKIGGFLGCLNWVWSLWCRHQRTQLWSFHSQGFFSEVVWGMSPEIPGGASQVMDNFGLSCYHYLKALIYLLFFILALSVGLFCLFGMIQLQAEIPEGKFPPWWSSSPAHSPCQSNPMVWQWKESSALKWTTAGGEAGLGAS